MYNRVVHSRGRQLTCERNRARVNFARLSVENRQIADKEPEPIVPADESDMPLPSDPKVIFLAGLFAFVLLFSVYLAKEIILPIFAAFILKLLLQPAMRFLERWWGATDACSTS